MSIKYRCPGCGQVGTAGDESAGLKVACESCGKRLQVPGTPPTATEAATGPIPFRCDHCGTSFAAPARLAGKKVKCSQCGLGTRVPGEPSPTTATPAAPAAPSPRPSPRPKAAVVEPGPADIFGFDDLPAPTKAGAGDAVVLDGRPGLADDGAPLPPRAGAFEPMTEAKKKQIRKRADKINKTMPSFAGAGAGISFGAVLTFALIGWRVYRVVNRFNGPAKPPAAFAAAADFNRPADPKAVATQIDTYIDELIQRPDADEARAWLDAAKHPDHVVVEMGNDRARALVAGFYERGAVKVWVVDTDKFNNTIVTTTIAIQLPRDPAARAQCLAYEVQFLDGEEPTRDLGQKYLQISTD